MASFAKQNKTQVSRIKNTLEKSLRSKVSNMISGNQNTTLGRVNVYSPKDEMGMDLSYTLFIVLNKANVVVKEIDGRLVFCLDLRDCSVGLQSNRRSIQINIMSAYRSRYYREDVYDEITREVGVLDSRDFDKLEQTSFYHRTVSKIEDMCYQSKVVLRDGEYPFMNERNLFPLIVFDTSTGSGWFIYGDKYSNMSYRSNHTQIDFSTFNISSHVESILRGIPMSLTKVVDPKGNMLYVRS